MKRTTLSRIRYEVNLHPAQNGETLARSLVFLEPDTNEVFELPMSDEEARVMGKLLAEPRPEPDQEPVPARILGER